MDIRVFHPNAPSNKSKSLKCLYKNNEREKKRKYNSRVINVEKSTFTPLVFSTHGGMAPECRALFQRAGKLIAEKRKEKYADIMHSVLRGRKYYFRSNSLFLIFLIIIYEKWLNFIKKQDFWRFNVYFFQNLPLKLMLLPKIWFWTKIKQNRIKN